MKRFLSMVIIIGTLVSCAAAADVEVSNIYDPATYSTVTFDSVRELVEWVQSCDPQEYSGDFKNLIQEIQTKGELFSVTSESTFKHGYGVIIPKHTFIIFYFWTGDQQLQVEFRAADSALLSKHPDAADYFSAKYPSSTVEKTSLELVIDGERKTVSAVTSTTEMGENKVPVETVGFLGGDFEVKITTWSAPVDKGMLNNLSFANLPLDGKYITNINAPGKNGVSYTGYHVPTENRLVQSVDIEGYDEDIIFESFEDVKREDWFAWAVILTVYTGTMSGTGERTFSPHDDLTRAQFANTLWRMSNCKGYYEYHQKQSEFLDVPQGEWYTIPMIWAAENYVAKISNGMLDPHGAISRQEFALLLYRYITRYMGITYTDTASNYDEFYPKIDFSDAANVSDYAKEAVEHVSRWGLMLGKADGKFDPRGNITRAEAAIVIDRLRSFL